MGRKKGSKNKSSEDYFDKYIDESTRASRNGLLAVIWFAGLVSTIWLLILTFGLSGYDAVDVNEFGERLCGSKGLIYDGRDWHKENKAVPIIKCKENSTESVFDGVVVKVVD